MGEGTFAAHDGGTALEQNGGAHGGDELHQYRNLIVEFDADGGEPALWDRSWLGRILVLRVPGGLIYIGPHWYCSVVMLSFIPGAPGPWKPGRCDAAARRHHSDCPVHRDVSAVRAVEPGGA
ncbi:unnamed protein product [Prorocentrum cordatum]|uniref:Uncharacterized protein n=1 Tax=Prorocentrum cordatum TaxID=2364126 RepID=A0ABN9Q035_9DINO|nr:unnamed protein product [Polarella glacialis]